MPRICHLLVVFLASAALAKKEDENECEVCKSVVNAIDALLTPADRKDSDSVEKVMQKYCNTAKLQDKKMCYLDDGWTVKTAMQACGPSHIGPFSVQGWIALVWIPGISAVLKRQQIIRTVRGKIACEYLHTPGIVRISLNYLEGRFLTRSGHVARRAAIGDWYSANWKVGGASVRIALTRIFAESRVTSFLVELLWKTMEIRGVGFHGDVGIGGF